MSRKHGSQSVNAEKLEGHHPKDTARIVKIAILLPANASSSDSTIE
jgi:hypothetical protein